MNFSIVGVSVQLLIQQISALRFKQIDFLLCNIVSCLEEVDSLYQISINTD